MVIFKYALYALNELPVGYKIRHFGVCPNSEILCIWVEVDPEQPKIPVKVQYFDTGYELPAKRKQYLGTTYDRYGTLSLVRHHYLFY